MLSVPGPVTTRARRRRVLLGLGALLLGALAADTVRLALRRPLAVAGALADDGYVRVTGVVHVHTTHSDGGGTPAEVVTAARAAGLNFLFLSDHNNLDAKPVEGYHDRLLVGVGTEISTTDGHLLALGLPDPALRFYGDPSEALDDVRALGGVAFAAHPSSARADFRWQRWDLPGPWGLELLNGDSQWRAAGAWRLFRTLTGYVANREAALVDSLSNPGDTLQRWDRLLARRPTPAIVGADAHSRVPLGRDRGGSGRALRFPAYEPIFRLARNHVLLDAPLSGSAARDLATVASALGRGRSYVGVDALAPADGFFCVIEGSGQRFTMGDDVPWSAGLRLRAGGRMPAATRLSLLRDGAVVAQANLALDAALDQPGVYRVEARIPGWSVPWVLTNAFSVFDPVALAARRAHAAWPEPTPSPVVRQALNELAAAPAGRFGVEVDPSSSLVPEWAAVGEGPDGGQALRLGFHLGEPGPQRHGWAALMERSPRDLAGFEGLVMSVRADGFYRFWVQVRDENPRGSDDGHETWLTSVRAEPAWRRIHLPFSRFRSLDPGTDGSLDRARVRSLGFVLDDLTVKPGTRGTLWLAQVGLY